MAFSNEFLGAQYGTPITITDRRVRVPGRTTNFKRRAFEGGAHQWMLEIPLEPDPLGRMNLGARIQAHQDGLARSFRIPMPQHLGVEPVEDTTVAVNEAAEAGANRVPLKKTTAGRLFVQTGYFIKFAGHDKVYRVQNGRSSPTPSGLQFASVSHRPTMLIRPNLVEDVAEDEAVDFAPDIVVQWGDQTEWGAVTYDEDGFFGPYYAYFDEAV